MPTKTKVPTEAHTLAPTPVPLSWKRIYIGQEFPRDNINAIVFDPKDPDVIYVGTQNAGVYKSIDGGLSWYPSHNGLGGAWVSSLVIDPQNPQTLYVGIAFGGVYKTTNGGENWYPINNGINDIHQEISVIVISPGESQRLYYSQGYKLYTTTNGGESWTEILMVGWESNKCPRFIVNLIVDPTDSSRLIAFSQENPEEIMVCQKGVYLSPDGGQSWALTLQLEPVFGMHSAILLFDKTGENLYVADALATNKRSIYHSTDHGESWYQPSDIYCTSFTIDPYNGSTVFCSPEWNIQIRVSRDSGESWQDFFSSDARIQTIVVSPHSGQTVLIGGKGLWLTTDSGKRWTSLYNGLGAVHLDLSFDPLESSALQVEDDECNVYSSSDAGYQWNLAPERTCQRKMALTTSGEWLFWIDKIDGSLHRSKNQGATSQKMAWPIENINPFVIVSHPVEPNRVFAIYDLESPFFFLSDDLGETWHGAILLGWNEYAHADPASRMFFDHEQGQRIYLVTYNDVYRSDDAGESWQICSNPKSYLGGPQRKSGMIIQPENADHILLATRGSGILVSTDGCQFWKPSYSGLDSLFVNTLAIDPNNSEIVYAGTDGGAYVSFDGGQTWGQVNDGLLGATVVYSIAVDQDSNVYAATPYGIFKLETK
jgi:photosystem II stability/assembly factor-like uncharacterized protein